VRATLGFWYSFLNAWGINSGQWRSRKEVSR
jgi:hypothetical protein